MTSGPYVSGLPKESPDDQWPEWRDPKLSSFQLLPLLGPDLAPRHPSAPLPKLTVVSLCRASRTSRNVHALG